MIEFKNKKWGTAGKDYTKTDQFIFCNNGLTLFLDKVSIKSRGKDIKNTLKGKDLQKANESLISFVFELNCQNTQKFKYADMSILDLTQPTDKTPTTFEMVTDGQYYTYKYLYDVIQDNGIYINVPCTKSGLCGSVHDARTNDYVGVLTFKRL